jgi:hypothetical protein
LRAKYAAAIGESKEGPQRCGTLAHAISSGAVALLELLFAATRAWIVATHIFQGIARWFLRGVVAVRAMHVTMVVVMMVVVVVFVVAVRAVYVGLLGHR